MIAQDIAVIDIVLAHNANIKPRLDKSCFAMSRLQRYYDHVYLNKRRVIDEQDVIAVEVLERKLEDVSKYFSRQDLDTILKSYPCIDWHKQLGDKDAKKFKSDELHYSISRPFYSRDFKFAILQLTRVSAIEWYILSRESERWKLVSIMKL